MKNTKKGTRNGCGKQTCVTGVIQMKIYPELYHLRSNLDNL